MSNNTAMVDTEPDYFKPFRYYIAGFSIFFFVVLVLLYIYFGLNFDLVKIFFNFFELTPCLKAFFELKLQTLISHATLTDIAIVFAFIVGIFYFLWAIDNQGFQVFEGYDIYGKHFQTALYILAILNAFFLIPFILFLILVGNSIFDRWIECGLVIGLYLISVGLAKLFSTFGNLLKDYNNLILFSQSLREPFDPFNIFTDSKTCLKFFIMARSFFSKWIVLFMFLGIFFVTALNFNLFTLFYLELILLFWYFIICSVTKIPGGTANVFLNNGEIFNRVFITEEGRSGYIITLHEGNLQKKTMKSSIKYIEPSDPPN